MNRRHHPQRETTALATRVCPVESTSVGSDAGETGERRAPRRVPERSKCVRPRRTEMSSKMAEVVPGGGGRGGRGKKRKLAEAKARGGLPSDKAVTELPASAAYTRLCHFERKVDAALARKKAEINEAIKRPARAKRTVRVYVYNTFRPASTSTVAVGAAGSHPHPQGSASDGAAPSTVTEVEPASWTLHVQGRVLAPRETAEGSGEYDPESEPKFSAFVRSLEVRLDPALYPDAQVAGGAATPTSAAGAGASSGVGAPGGSVIRWDADEAPANAAPTDGFEIKRAGDRDCRVKIALRMDYQPERYKLSAGLSAVLGLDLETRPRIIAALWQYVKLHDLLDPDDATVVVLDRRLTPLFMGANAPVIAKMPFMDMAEKLHAHLTPAPPIEFDYVIRTSGLKNPTMPDCYDILVDVPVPATAGHHQFIERLRRDADVDACNARIATNAKKIAEHVRRRTFFLGFSHSPVDFINTIVAAQARDMAVVRGDGEKRREAERRSELYQQPWVDEAVMRYITRRSNE